jgi:hypothetical protein
METIRAIVSEVEGKHVIEIQDEENPIRIPMSEDRPKEVKKAFNRLLVRMRAGEFRIELAEVGEDLFSQVANEYLSQLNREIRGVYDEMKHYDLV